jgi:hypothetical protein
MLAGLPFVGRFFAIIATLTKPLTYYRVDTALMFQSITHGAVLSALESVIDAKGARVSRVAGFSSVVVVQISPPG